MTTALNFVSLIDYLFVFLTLVGYTANIFYLSDDTAVVAVVALEYSIFLKNSFLNIKERPEHTKTTLPAPKLFLSFNIFYIKKIKLKADR